MQAVVVCVYLDFTGILGCVDELKGFFNGLAEGDHTVISQHQNLQETQARWQNSQVKQVKMYVC